MFDFLDKNNVGKAYKDFYLVAVEDLPDLNCKGIYLRHKLTGLEVYHVAAPDEENLFAFTFRTVSLNSKGTAHIMEHSALCGSEKFPLKEPFTTLENQSVKSFLNALTYPQKTSYPAASLVKSDYFNLFDVYADAVFFPLLAKETFMQEGHRLEVDDKGNYSIQGVVYNEMKGNYSSFNSVARDSIVSSLFPESYASFDSGGDPLAIPELSYEEFVDFHNKFYRPDNCLLFLYGNIPTNEQLDFITDKFVSRLVEKYPYNAPENFLSPLPIVPDEIKQLSKLNKNVFEKDFNYLAPGSDASGLNVTMNWYTGEKNIEKQILAEALCGAEFSPLSVKLIDSGLGDEISPFSRVIVQYDETFFSCGLSGVKKGNENKIKQLILDSLKEVYNEGFSDELIDGIIMAMDFDLRECSRGFGPYSLNVLSSVSKNWFSGIATGSNFDMLEELKELKKKIHNNPDYLKNLLKELFIDTKYNSFVVVEPSDKFYEERNAQEEKLVEKLKKEWDLRQLKKELDALHEYQQKVETPEELSCIPHLKINDLTVPKNDESLKMEFIQKSDSVENKIPLLISTEDTKGICYMEIMFPFDVLPPEDYVYVPLLLEVSGSLGWAGKNWQQADTEAAKFMRDFTGDSISFTGYDFSKSKELEDYVKSLNLYHRDWFSLSSSFLAEYSDSVFNVLSDAISKMEFKDTKRFSEIIAEDWNEIQTSFVSSCNRLIQLRAAMDCDRTMFVRELQHGITQLEKFETFKKENPKKILEKLEAMYQKLLKAGVAFHITADKESQKKIVPLIKNLVETCNLNKPAVTPRYEKEDFIPYISQYEQKSVKREVVKYASQIGAAVLCVQAVKPGYTKESVAMDVLTSWMSNHILWDKIRTTGGAYGAHAAYDHGLGSVTISSYRDPNPEFTIDLYMEILKEVAEFDFTYEDVEPCIIAGYSDEIVPMSKEGKGVLDLRRYLNGNAGLTPYFVEILLSINEKDIKNAAKQLYETALKNRSEAVFCDISKNIAGKKLELPL